MADFLVGYGILAGAALACVGVVRWFAGRGPGTLDRPPAVLDLAYLRGGFTHACHACLAGLHRAGAIRPAELSTLVAVGPPSEAWPPLMVALHAGLRTAQSWTHVTALPEVLRAGERVRRRLLRRGLLLSTTRQRWMKAATAPLFAVAAVGVARLVASAAGEAPAGKPGETVGLILAVTGTALAGWLLLEVPAVSGAGRRAIRRAARELRAAPEGGSTALVMRKVAVGGRRALVALAPTIAVVIGVSWGKRAPFYVARSGSRIR
ncbi:TIGR04222 domain-containing membrane protein [Phytohabitans aurantiacus]|uniref:Type II secretion system protein GspF domain-containing protein n=1 Tax=Phytohabitans aurantiacus TaxID=3016789 RepID=A0ABQ5R1Z9_9ACTN|nr:TIGR04222 domain-containing membrane protein [Phytohabitans aurantiacus]GLI00766.1 hypothetical protein Pa4123_60420 [Phytohabitans aurantiacus]